MNVIRILFVVTLLAIVAGITKVYSDRLKPETETMLQQSCFNMGATH